MTATFKQSQIFSFMLATLAAMLLSVLIAPQQAQASELADNPEVLAESDSEAQAAACGSSRTDTSNQSGWGIWQVVRESGCRSLSLSISATSSSGCVAYYNSYIWNPNTRRWGSQQFFKYTGARKIYNLQPGEWTATQVWTNGRCGVHSSTVRS